MSTGSPDIAERGHYAVLDGLRGVAACLVVLAHSNLFRYPSTAAARWAVDLFFVLSGFLITRILLANRVDHRPAWTFWLNRAARILPIYYLTVLVAWLGWQDPLAPWAAAYISNYRYFLTQQPSMLNHTWSLCIEEHFYLVWPLVVGAVSTRASRRLITAMIVVGALLCFVMGGIAYVSVTSRVMSLGAGSLFAYAEPSFKRSARRLAAAALGLLTSSGLLYAAWTPSVRWAIGLSPRCADGFDTFFLLATMASASAAVLALALWAETGSRVLRPVLTNRVITRLGSISYGLYLYHYPIFSRLGVFAGGPDPRTTALRALAATVATAILSYHVLEMPIRRAARRLITTHSAS